MVNPIARGPKQPYPGLRSFTQEESAIFFGREDQSDVLLEKLKRTRFLTVVGPSGCGKSSLIRAGLITGLRSGFMGKDVGARWRVAEMRPGDSPLRRLAEALTEEGALSDNYPPLDSVVDDLVNAFERGPLSLREILAEAKLPEKTNFLLLVDQFEEIFRFRKPLEEPDLETYVTDSESELRKREADAFVALILKTFQQREFPAYVVITMRSDFFGDCALLRGLPEAINDSQYLTPRLGREQLRAAIEGPAATFGCKIDPPLVNTLLNDVGPDPDQLPLLQHALMRMWTLTQERKKSGDPDDTNVDLIALQDYRNARIDGLKNALSKHVEDDVFLRLTAEQQRIAELMFKCLTERGKGQRDTRRPTTLGNVALVASGDTARASEAAIAQIVEVIEEFREEGRNFIFPAKPRELRKETTLDVGHESLIRQWQRLNQWVDEEAESADEYLHLKKDAALWKSGKGALLPPTDLDRILKWRAIQQPSEAWASRYGKAQDFLDVDHFVQASDAERRKALAEANIERERRRRERQTKFALMAGFSVACLALAVGMGLFAYQARQQRTKADYSRTQAGQKSVEAKKQANIAQSQRLAMRAREVLPSDPELAAQIAREAFVNVAETDEARSVLASATYASPLLKTFSVGDKRLVETKFSADGRRLVAISARGVFVWDIATSKLLGEWGTSDLALGELTLKDLAIDPSSGLIALSALDRALIWDTTIGKNAQRLRSSAIQTFHGTVERVAFRQDGSQLLTFADWASAASIWDLRDGGRMRLEHPDLRTARFSIDGRTILTGSNCGTAILWDSSTGKPKRRFTPLPPSGWCSSDRTSPRPETYYDDSVNASGSQALLVRDQTAYLYNALTGNLIKPLTHEGIIFRGVFSRDGKFILTMTFGDAKVWHAENGELAYTLDKGKLARIVNSSLLAMMPPYEYGA
jgi:hypothetical protein